MVDVRVLRVVFTLVVRGCRAFKLLVLLVGVVVVLVRGGVWFAVVI